MMIPSTLDQTPLKLHLAQIPNQNLITGYGNGYVLINGQRYEHSLIVTPKTIVPDWPANFDDGLDESHLIPVLKLAPQIIVIGSGTKLRFPKPAVLKALIAARVGYEVMDTRAACRTYNILVEEGRNVAAALILG